MAGNTITIGNHALRPVSLSWSHIAHFVDGMHADEEVKPVLVQQTDGTIVEVQGVLHLNGDIVLQLRER